MVIKPSIYIDDMTGSAGQGTVRRSKNRLTLAKKATPTNPKTSKQQGVRANFTSLAKGWSSLTASQRSAWEALAETQKGRSALGEKATISGYDVYMRCNLNLMKAGLSTLAEPGASVEAPNATAITVSATGTTSPNAVTALKVNATWDGTLETGKFKLVVAGSPIQSAGRAISANKISYIKAYDYVIATAGTAVETAILDDYQAEISSLGGFVGVASQHLAIEVCLLEISTGLKSTAYKMVLNGSEVSAS